MLVAMAGKSKRPKLEIEPEELNRLHRLRQTPTAPLREIQRAQILTRYYAGETVAQIARNLHMTRKSVAKWINRALAMGTKAALKDAYHRPREPSITEEARAWVVSLACIKPKDLGYAAEMWTRSALANHVRSHAVVHGIRGFLDIFLHSGAILLKTGGKFFRGCGPGAIFEALRNLRPHFALHDSP